MMITENVLREGAATYWAFDPGETTGYATFNEEGELMAAGQIYGFDSLVEWLAVTPSDRLKAVICEDFIILRKKAAVFAGNKMEVIQAKGAIRAHTSSKKVKFILQRSDIKPIAERLTGVRPKGKHSENHWVDALNHGKYYLIKQGICKGNLDDNTSV